MVSIDYIAGFLDGEGCFTIRSCRTVLQGAILITNTNKDVLTSINVTLTSLGVSGKIYKVKRKKVGCKDVYNLTFQTMDSVQVLCKLLKDKLVVKTTQCKMMAKFVKMQKDREGRNLTSDDRENEYMYYVSMKLLNR